MNKFFLVLLFLLPALGISQTVVKIVPLISTTTVDSVTITSGSDTLLALNDDLDSANHVGMRIMGQGIPFGTTIETVVSDSMIIISNNATATTTLGTVSFEEFSNTAYSAGDALGFPIKLQPFKKITQIVVEDDAKQITSVDFIFYDTLFTATADNIPIAPPDFDAKNIVGYVTVGGTNYHKVLGNNHVLVLPFTTLPVTFSAKNLYCQMIVVGTPTFTAMDNIRIKFVGE